MSDKEDGPLITPSEKLYEEQKNSTPKVHIKKVVKDNAMLLDFTHYLSCTSGDDSDSLKDCRSRSYTPTKLLSRRMLNRLPPSELMNKLTEKQK